MVDLRSIAREYGPLAGAPRGIFIRASLENARILDQAPCRLASPPDSAENAQAFAISEPEAKAALPTERIPSCWGHQNASYWIKHAEVDSQACTYTSEELRVAATFCAAELQVSRDTQPSELELHVFSLASSARELIAGWRKGRQLGLTKFLASAGTHNGASFTLNGVFRREWGLKPKASPEHIIRPMEDMARIPSSLRLTAWRLGAWPALFTGTQTAMSLG